jgi:Polyketide cyclase / dehydrase and lipid transport
VAFDFTGTAVVGAPADRVRALVADLGTYPRWLGIVRRAEPDGPGAWLVDIGGRVGPFTRTKRVRMVRTGGLRFERDEGDGRAHAAWVLEADVAEAAGADGTRVEVRLHYGGGVPLPGLSLLLAQEAAKAGSRLQKLLADEAREAD